MAADLVLTPPTSSGVATYPPGATYGPRRLRDHELVWVLEGEVEYRVGAARLTAPAESFVLCRPGTTDFFRWDPGRRTRHAYVHFSVVSVPDGWPSPQRWPVVRPAGDGDLLRPLLEQLLTPGGEDPVLARCVLASALAAFVLDQATSVGLPSEPLPGPVERALAHLRLRLDDDPQAVIGLRELAEAACVTPGHLCRLFRRATGRTPVETVRLARLDRALGLLAGTNYSITEIATMCGFSSPFHFSRRFKEAFGQPPRAVRAEVRAGAVPPTSRLLRVR